MLAKRSGLHSMHQGTHTYVTMQVLHGKPQELLPKVWSDWGITKLCFEVDTEPYAKERDSSIQELAQKHGRPHLPGSCSSMHTMRYPSKLRTYSGLKILSRLGHQTCLVAAGLTGPTNWFAEPQPTPLIWTLLHCLRAALGLPCVRMLILPVLPIATQQPHT